MLMCDHIHEYVNVWSYLSNIDCLLGNTTYIAQAEGEGDIWQVVLPWIRQSILLLLTTSDI